MTTKRHRNQTPPPALATAILLRPSTFRAPRARTLRCKTLPNKAATFGGIANYNKSWKLEVRCFCVVAVITGFRLHVG